MQNCTTPFYLTGGTALNRAYLNVRYSDDLDFFVNDYRDFPALVDKTIEKIVEAAFDFDRKTLVVSENFVSLFLTHPDFSEKLKIDFVNDIPVYFGKCEKSQIFYSTDNIENILTNKLSALIGRTEAKDIVDLHSIAKRYSFSWAEAISKAEKKEASIDVSLIAGLLCELKEEDFNKIKWIKRPDYKTFMEDMNDIAKDILCLGENSCFEK